MHSYLDEIVPKAYLKDGKPTPDVCIGTDTRFTPPRLLSIVRCRLEGAGFTTELNYPYSGCFVPNAAIAGRGDCISVMLEFHKRVYLDAQGKPNAEKTAVIRGIMEKILTDCVALDDSAYADCCCLE